MVGRAVNVGNENELRAQLRRNAASLKHARPCACAVESKIWKKSHMPKDRERIFRPRTVSSRLVFVLYQSRDERVRVKRES
jgi:hypothetical protein